MHHRRRTVINIEQNDVVTLRRCPPQYGADVFGQQSDPRIAQEPAIKSGEVRPVPFASTFLAMDIQTDQTSRMDRRFSRARWWIYSIAWV